MHSHNAVAGEDGKAHSRGATPAVVPPRANIAPSRAGAGARRSTAELEVRWGEGTCTGGSDKVGAEETLAEAVCVSVCASVCVEGGVARARMHVHTHTDNTPASTPTLAQTQTPTHTHTHAHTCTHITGDGQDALGALSYHR